MRKKACNTLIISPIPRGGGGKLSYTQLVPEIFPDYREVTIPPNIALLNFLISSLVYPSWHPSGEFFGFSTDKTTHNFHPTQWVGMFNLVSNVYDIEERIILSTLAIFLENNFKTFPTFSADSKTLYCYTAATCAVSNSIHDLKYGLCSVSFDPEEKSFGDQIDTLYSFGIQGQNIPFSRVSTNGRYLMYIHSSNETFPVWYQNAKDISPVTFRIQ